jgi:hypothetical protein
MQNAGNQREGGKAPSGGDATQAIAHDKTEHQTAKSFSCVSWNSIRNSTSNCNEGKEGKREKAHSLTNVDGLNRTEAAGGFVCV